MQDAKLRENACAAPVKVRFGCIRLTRHVSSSVEREAAAGFYGEVTL